MSAPWTREQIEAWVRRYDDLEDLTTRVREVLRLVRGTYARLCPEAADYDDLDAKISALPESSCSATWHHTVTDEEAVASATRVIAALWAQATEGTP